jgi:hypothetical protein
MGTYVELVQGLRNKSELNTLKNFLQSLSVPVLHVTESISSTVMFLEEQHHFSVCHPASAVLHYPGWQLFSVKRRNG